MNGHRVMLIRARPGSEASEQALRLARQWAGTPEPALLFFHGPGLGHVLPAQRFGFASLRGDGLSLSVCRAGWQRLKRGDVPEPFVEGSLLQFWDAVLSAEDVRSFGALGDG
ncbi:MAG TPA: hypothetical protein VKO38_01860 [Wenzhouxiangella sp.]|nr:hypothetical protein [Wenzhouxiangella sp.]